jgi:hypothetical protein
MNTTMTKTSPAASLEDQEKEYVDVRDPLAHTLRTKLNLDGMKLWFITLIYLGPVEKLILPYFSGILKLVEVGIRQWNPHIEALLTGFVEFPIFMGYYLWSGRGVVEVFESFREKRSFTDLDEFDRFMRTAMADFRRRLWPLISLAFALLTMLAMNFVIWAEGSDVPPWFGDLLYFRILASTNLTIVAYAVCQVLIRESLVIYWLRRLWSEMGDKLEIHPYDSDGAGGLGAIGKHAVALFSFVLIVMLFILMATILPEFVKTSPENTAFSLRFWSPLVLGIWVIYLIMIPLMFFLLIWPAHKAMLAKRDEQLEVYSGELEELLGAAEKSALGERGKLEGILNNVSQLKNMRSVILQDYPVWPASTQAKGLLGFTSALPTAYSILLFLIDVLS